MLRCSSWVSPTNDEGTNPFKLHKQLRLLGRAVRRCKSLETICMAGTCKMEKKKSLRSFLKKTHREGQRPECSGRSKSWKINADELR